MLSWQVLAESVHRLPCLTSLSASPSCSSWHVLPACCTYSLVQWDGLFVLERICLGDESAGVVLNTTCIAA